MEAKKIKIALGMSGGVDSSVAALLLKQQGYLVVGLFMKLWHDPTCDVARENSCCDEQAERDARRIAKMLGIQFYVVDAREPFRKAITDYFIDEYKNLRTPNPCIRCNKLIKFGWLLDYAEKLGCSYLATGHYARILNSSELSITNYQLPINSQQPDSDKSIDNYWHLLKGVDSSKDQSYFLYQLSQEQLSKIIFPLGEMTKPEVRKIALENKLPVYEKAESQEICFIQDKDHREFLRRHLPTEYFKQGKIILETGEIVGEHNGLVNYTIGQRRNVNQELRITFHGKDKEPLYVTGFDFIKNELIVGFESSLYRSEFEIEEANWLNPLTELRIKNNELGDVKVKIRYKSEEVPCAIEALPNSKFRVRTSIPVRALANGQSAVFHNGEEVLGGGIISSNSINT